MVDLTQLPAVEQDVLVLTEQHGKSQNQIAQILGVSQPTVNYRLKRAKARRQFLSLVPEVSPEEVRHVMEALGADEQHIKIMLLYIEHKSQSEVARTIDRSQGAVRHWLLQGESLLKKDKNPDDTFRRVRTACQLLVNKPTNEIDTKEVKDSNVKYEAPPKVEGDLVLGETVTIRNGLCEGLDALVAEGHLVITLVSRRVYVTW